MLLCIVDLELFLSLSLQTVIYKAESFLRTCATRCQRTFKDAASQKGKSSLHVLSRLKTQRLRNRTNR
eukprot:4198998-Amphidinium_carterae.1